MSVGQNELGLAEATLWVDGWRIEDGEAADEKAGSCRVELGELGGDEGRSFRAVIRDCLVVVIVVVVVVAVEGLVNTGDIVVAERFMELERMIEP